MAGAPRQYHIKADGQNAAAIDAYLEYHRIVGDDDGGQMFTPEEYENYKRKVLPMRMKNRLFTAYTSSSGMDCKLIGPETVCFCSHRYKQHQTDFETIPKERPILLPCRAPGCMCASYHYVPMNGGQPIRCSCKHFADEHSEKAPYHCKKGGCTKCTGFTSSFSCACGATHREHRMIVETADEREARGHPVGQATPYQAMGGLTGFSSLAEGYMRLDPSGRGAPDEAWLSQPITAQDNPFLRSQVQSIKAHQMAKGIKGADSDVFGDQEERISGVKRPGESDMDFYERRYQERLKLERAGPSRPAIDKVTPGPRKALEGPKTVAKKYSGASTSKNW